MPRRVCFKDVVLVQKGDATGSEDTGGSGSNEGDALGLGYGSDDASADEHQGEQQQNPIEAASNKAAQDDAQRVLEPDSRTHADIAAEDLVSDEMPVLSQMEEGIANGRVQALDPMKQKAVGTREPAAAVASSAEDILRAYGAAQDPTVQPSTALAASSTAATFSKGDRCQYYSLLALWRFVPYIFAEHEYCQAWPFLLLTQA